MQFRAARAVIAVPVVAAGALAATSVTASADSTVTGTRLAAALLPARAFPHFTLIDKRDSGRRLETGPAKYHLGVQGCTSFARFYGHPGYGETAVASSAYSALFGGFGSGSTQSFRQTVYQFASAKAAQAFFRGLQAQAARCPGWLLQVDRSGGGSASGGGTGPAAGRDGMVFQVTASVSSQAGSGSDSAEIVLIGRDVAEVDAMSANRDLPAAPALDTLAHQLIVRVHAAR